MAEEMSRREFVRLGALLGAGVALATVPGCAGSSGPSRTSKEAETSTQAEVETPSATYGGDGEVSKRILVGYATRTGSTVGVAEAIGETLGARGFAVDVKPLKERPSLEGYDAVVLGSAINGAQWLPEAVGFVEANRDALGKTPAALFCVHAMNLGDDERQRRKRLAYLGTIREIIKPADEGYFAGKGPTAEDSSLIARWAFKAFGGGGEGDLRDWDEIRSWARQARV